MQRGLFAVAAAALLCGACALTLMGLAKGGMPVQELVLLTCGVTLAMAAMAAGFSARALMRANAAQADLMRLARSVDSAMRDLSARNDRSSSTVEELNALVSRELELFSARPPRPRNGAEAPVSRDNIVALPSSRRARQDAVPPPAPASDSAPEPAGFALAVQRAVAAGQPDISLQPIVSISQGAAIGFEVHAHFARDDGMSVDLQRLPSALPDLSQAAFERWLVVGALGAAGMQFRAGAESLPLHVKVSEAMLGDGEELNKVIDTLGEAKSAARLIVLSMPAAALERSARHLEAIQQLVDTGVGIAAESWSGNADSLQKMRSVGVTMLKLSADRLLGRAKLAKASNNAIKILEIAAEQDVPMVVVNVANDEDAVSLIDLGINLMTGNRFSGPRRLKPESDDRAEKVARF